MDEIVDDLIVPKAVYEAALHVEALADDPAWHFAEMVRDEFKRVGMKEKAAFWQEVKDCLFMMMVMDRKARIILLPDA
jgi:aspartokinase-like uncharacterized kinase